MVKNNLNPMWEPFKVSLNSLCSCEETRPLKVQTSSGRPAEGRGQALGGAPGQEAEGPGSAVPGLGP